MLALKLNYASKRCLVDFIHIFQAYFTGTGAIIWLLMQWSCVFLAQTYGYVPSKNKFMFIFILCDVFTILCVSFSVMFVLSALYDESQVLFVLCTVFFFDLSHPNWRDSPCHVDLACFICLYNGNNQSCVITSWPIQCHGRINYKPTLLLKGINWD